MAKTRDYLDYLDENIEIAPANSQEEYQAAEKIAGVMKDHGLKPSVEEFEAHPWGELLPAVLTIVMFAALVATGLTEGVVHVVTLVLAIVGVAVLLLSHYMHNLFEDLGPAVRSQNVVAVHRAEGDKVVKGARPIVIVAHYDTPRESLTRKGPLAQSMATIRRTSIPCAIAVAVVLLLQALSFLPGVIRTFTWVVGILAAVPLLLLAIITIYDKNAPCTMGANDNKSSVAALLSILNKVRPYEDRVDKAAANGGSRQRAVDRAEQREMESQTRQVKVVEEVYGVRHGKDMLMALGILPPSCEIVYEEPKVRVIDQMPAEAMSSQPDTTSEYVRESDDAYDTDERLDSYGEADVEETYDEDVREGELNVDEPEVEEDASGDATDDVSSEDQPKGSGGEDEDYDYDEEYEEEDYDEFDDDEYGGEKSPSGIGLWFSERVANIREFFSKRKQDDSNEDSSDEDDVDGTADNYEEDEAEEDLDSWIDDDAEYDEDEFESDELASDDPEVLDEGEDYEEFEEGEDDDFEDADSFGEDDVLESYDEEGYGEELYEEEQYELEESEEYDELIEDTENVEYAEDDDLYEYDEELEEEMTSDDELLEESEEDLENELYGGELEDVEEEDDSEYDDEFEDYDEEDEPADEYEDELGEEYAGEYEDESEEELEEEYEEEPEEEFDYDFEDDDEEEIEDDYNEWFDSDEDDFDDEDAALDDEDAAREHLTLGERLRGFINRMRGTSGENDEGYLEEDGLADESEDAYEDDSYGDEDEWYEEEEKALFGSDAYEEDYEDEYLAEEYDGEGYAPYEPYEASEEDEAYGFVEDAEADDKPSERLPDPNELHFDRVEDADIVPRDTTGLDMFSDSYDLYDPENVRTDIEYEKPRPVDDPHWGTSSYQPARPALNIARRAALYDIPDPSASFADPFAEDDEYESEYEEEYYDYDDEETVEDNDVYDTYEERDVHDGFWGDASSREQSDWKGGATVRSDLRDDEGEPIVIDADDLQDAILEMGDEYLVAHDIWFVATGASSIDHAGIKAFLAEHRRDIRGSFLVNLESIGAGSLSIVVREGLHDSRRADRRLVRMLTTIAQDLHIPMDTAMYDWDECDSASAMRARVRSVSIMGIDDNNLPAYAQTREDLPDNVNPHQVSSVVRLVTELIRRS